MKTIFLALLLFSNSCILLSQKDSKFEVIAIKVTRNFPKIDNKGKVIRYLPTDSALIIFFENETLNFIPYQFDWSDRNNKIYKTEIRNQYFTSFKSDNYSYFTDSNLNIHHKKMPNDSLFALQWFYSKLLDSISNSTLLSSENKVSKKQIVNTYSFCSKDDASMKGTFILTYNEHFPSVDFSLSPKYDTLKNAKLVKYKIIYSPRYMKDYKLTIDEIILNREIELLNSDRTKHFEQDRVKNKF